MKPKSGMESMLRSMGLGEVLDGANQLAQSGAIGKLIRFAEEAEAIRGQLAQLLAQSAGRHVCPKCGYSLEPAGTSDDGGLERVGPSARSDAGTIRREPGAGSANATGPNSGGADAGITIDAPYRIVSN